MRILLNRIGAWGDVIIVTPLIRYLKQQGNEMYVLTSEDTGTKILENNPYVDKIIPYPKDSVPMEIFDKFLKTTQEAYSCQRLIDMNESIECTLALDRQDPQYNYLKKERIALCNQNYYDYAFKYAGENVTNSTGKGEVFFTPEEELWAEEFLHKLKNKGSYLVLWGLSGSGRNKAYPAAEIVIHDLLEKYKDMVILTVGDDVCKVLEPQMNTSRIAYLCGETTYRQSMILAKYVNLVICPDTGLLHSAGCFTTPKIGLFGHSTKENVTKYFDNDFSIEADCECAPCMRMVYNASIQCPIDPRTRGCWCMTQGLKATRVYEHICGVVDRSYYSDRRTEGDRKIIVPGGTDRVIAGRQGELIVAG